MTNNEHPAGLPRAHKTQRPIVDGYGWKMTGLGWMHVDGRIGLHIGIRVRVTDYADDTAGTVTALHSGVTASIRWDASDYAGAYLSREHVSDLSVVTS